MNCGVLAPPLEMIETRAHRLIACAAGHRSRMGAASDVIPVIATQGHPAPEEQPTGPKPQFVPQVFQRAVLRVPSPA
jgi:hypothetical protein